MSRNPIDRCIRDSLDAYYRDLDGENPSNVEQVLGFDAEVELLGDCLCEQLHEGWWVRQRRDGDTTDESWR